MTNKERARQIAEKNAQSYGWGLNSDSSVECYESAMEMAEWKEQQMIYKVVEWLKENLEDLMEQSISNAAKSLTIDLFLSRFKQAMEE